MNVPVTHSYSVWISDGVHDYGVLTESPVWSFTTTGPVAVEPTTWGRVKALFRGE